MLEHGFLPQQRTYCLRQHRFIVILDAICHAQNGHETDVDLPDNLLLLVLLPDIISTGLNNDLQGFITMNSVDSYGFLNSLVCDEGFWFAHVLDLLAGRHGVVESIESEWT